MNILKILFSAIVFLFFISSYASAGTKHTIEGKAFNMQEDTKTTPMANGFAMGTWSDNSWWVYSNPPEGWPEMLRAHCSGKGIPTAEGGLVAANFMCHAFDADQDVFMTRVSIDPATWNGTWDFIAGTGKYKGITGGGTMMFGPQISPTDSTLTFTSILEFTN